jgi:hypothetical protein
LHAAGTNLKRFIQAAWNYCLGILFLIYFASPPRRTEKLIFTVMDKIASQVKNIFAFLSQIMQETYIISGKLNGAGIRILYIGSRSRLPYILKLAGLDGGEVRRGGTVYFGNIRGNFACPATSADVVLAETGNFFSNRAQKKGFHLIPEWVKFFLPVPDSVQDLDRRMKKDLKNETLRIRKYSYSYEISRDCDKLNYFYHNMHVPYIRSRHAYLPYIHDYSLFRRVLKRGVVLFVKGKGGEYVSGNVLLLRNKTVWAKWAGIKDGNMEYLRRGARAASDFFVIKWAAENKFEMIDFGLTRAFFSDGVFHYKKKWGMTLSNYSLNNMFFGLKVCRESAGVKNFLEKNPFVFYRDGGLEGFVAVPGEYQNRKSLPDIQRHFMIPGITKLNLLCLGDDSREFRKICEEEHPGLKCINKDSFFQA